MDSLVMTDGTPSLGNGSSLPGGSNSAQSSMSSMLEHEPTNSAIDECKCKRTGPIRTLLGNTRSTEDACCLQVGVQPAGRTRRSASVRSCGRSCDSGNTTVQCRGTQTDTMSIGVHSVRGSQLSGPRYGGLVAGIGTELLRQTGAYPGFRQLQKAYALSQSQCNSNANLNQPADASVAMGNAFAEDRVSLRSKISAVNDVARKSLGNETTSPDLLLCQDRPRVSLDQQVESFIVRKASVPHDADHCHGNGGCYAHPEVGYRLGRRKKLYETRRRIADYTLICALFGISMAVLEMEATLTTATSWYAKNGAASTAVKSIITLSTLLLLLLEVTYHVVDIQLFCIDNCIEDWRVAIDYVRVLHTGCELLICSVHPCPGTPNFNWATVDLQGVVSSPSVSLDVVLTLPMFLRLYLIFRVMLLHSKLFTDASSRSIGAMNRIKFNIRFVLKTLMTLCPGTVLLVLILTLLIVASWSIRVCEGQHKSVFLNLLNSLWFVSITFMSIGYGDVVPESICGRLLAVFTGMMGSGCMALVVAVVARKLELTRAEKHVHNFMMDNQLSKSLRNSAANVLRETWLIYKFTRLSRRVNPYKVRYHQRKFFDAIQTLRKVKLDQRKLADHNARLVDLPKLHHQLHDSIVESIGEQQRLKDEVNQLATRMQTLECVIGSMPQAIATQIAAMVSDRLPQAGLQACRPTLLQAATCRASGLAVDIPAKGHSHNSLNSNMFSSADTVVNTSLSEHADKVVKCDEDRSIGRQTSCTSQPTQRLSKLAAMPDAFKSHSAVA